MNLTNAITVKSVHFFIVYSINSITKIISSCVHFFAIFSSVCRYIDYKGSWENIEERGIKIEDREKKIRIQHRVLESKFKPQKYSHVFEI